LRQVKHVVATFYEDHLSISVVYEHEEHALLGSPGSKKRTAKATQMARAALEAALEGLANGGAIWGGFGSGKVETTDCVLVERKEQQRQA
jgi:hypothetical protein